MNGELLRLTGLWKRTSANGREYLVGRLGAARLLVLENRDAGGEGEPDFIVFLAEIGERPASSTNSGPEARPTQRRARNAYEYLKPSRTQQSGSAPPLNDRVDDLWNGGRE